MLLLHGCTHATILTSMEYCASSSGFDHINRNAPVLIRTPKLTRFEPAQYWGGGPPGNSVVLNPFFLFCFFVFCFFSFSCFLFFCCILSGFSGAKASSWQVVLDSEGNIVRASARTGSGKTNEKKK